MAGFEESGFRHCVLLQGLVSQQVARYLLNYPQTAVHPICEGVSFEAPLDPASQSQEGCGNRTVAPAKCLAWLACAVTLI